MDNRTNISTRIAVLEEKVKSEKEQKTLQALEYERRLEFLNGEAERLRQMQAQYIPREVFDRTVAELRSLITPIARYVEGQKGKSQLKEWIPWVIAATMTTYSMFFKK